MFAYEQDLRPLIGSPELDLGTVTHACLAAIHSSAFDGVMMQKNAKDAAEKWIDETAAKRTMLEGGMQELRKTAELAYHLAFRAMEYIGVDRWETVSYNGSPLIERTLIVPLAYTGGYKFIPDWVARDRVTGTVWAFDYKVRKTLQEEDGSQFVQLPTYQAALHQLGIKVDGTATLQIRNKLPTIPKLNKDGSVSRENITTSWDIYRTFVIQHGLNVLDYEDMKDKLSNVKFFSMDQRYRNEETLQRIWSTIVEPAARGIAEGSVGAVMARTGFNCNRCDYCPICDAILDGDDVEWIKSVHYVKEERHKNAK
jgi:hypothetical protein